MRSPSQSGLPVLAIGALGAWIAYLLKARQAAERMAAAAFETLLNAVDANDPETGAHVRRVAQYAGVLADAAGLDGDERRMVERVALFHDIGKIHEALFDIIHDDEALSPEDREAIATHPARGASVLEPLCSFYPELPEGVLSHHERWDGKGYPRGLRGEEIPLNARIVTLADTFDAITHSRRYRPGQNADHAAQVFAENRGSQFDPALVDLMLSPPVWRLLLDMHREAHRPKRAERRSGRQEHPVPDVSFRWRGPITQ
jgi:HD-GYP domain-containing protein (c-di-GMP phosphodiesterase class II)